MGVCGVILSGGMSRRFQVPGEPWVDKALHTIEGVPMIRRAYDALQGVSDVIIVSVGSLERASSYRGVLGEALYVSDVEGLRGPLSGILAALEVCSQELSIVVPVDMPYISEDLLEELLSKLGGYDAVSPILPNGVVETAIIALRSGAARRVLEILRGYGRSRVADLHRGLPNIYLYNLKGHGFDPRVIANINTREDLGRGVEYPEGPVEVDVEIVRGFQVEDVEDRRYDRLRGSLWWTLWTGDPYEEFKLYLARGVYMFAAYALEDSGNGFERHAGEILLESLFKGL